MCSEVLREKKRLGVPSVFFRVWILLVDIASDGAGYWYETIRAIYEKHEWPQCTSQISRVQEGGNK